MHVQVLTYGINICTRAVIFGHIASQRLIHIRTTQYKQISLGNVRGKCCTRSVDFNQKYQEYVLRSKSRQVLTVHHSFQLYGNKFDSRDYKLSEWKSQTLLLLFLLSRFSGTLLSLFRVQMCVEHHFQFKLQSYSQIQY